MWAELEDTSDPIVNFWTAVTVDAFRAAQEGCPQAQGWFSPDCEQWVMLQTLLKPETARYIEREALKGHQAAQAPETRIRTDQPIPPKPAKPIKRTKRPDYAVTLEVRAEEKRIRERERYRTRTGFYDRRGLPTQESAPCPASFA